MMTKVNYSSKIKFQTELLFLVLCHISFYCTVSGAAAGCGFCANPVPSDNPVDLKWMHEHFGDGWNIQFGNENARNRISKVVKGIKNEEKDDYTGFCPKIAMDYVDEHFTGFYSGYGDKKAPFQCTKGTDFFCNLTSSDNITVTSRAYISYFDGKGKDEHNLMSIIACLPNNEASWFVVTISKTISEEETNTITEHLKSRGMNPDLRVSMQSSTC